MNFSYTLHNQPEDFFATLYRLKENGRFKEAITYISNNPKKTSPCLYNSELTYLYSELEMFEEAYKHSINVGEIISQSETISDNEILEHTIVSSIYYYKKESFEEFKLLFQSLQHKSTNSYNFLIAKYYYSKLLLKENDSTGYVNLLTELINNHRFKPEQLLQELGCFYGRFSMTDSVLYFKERLVHYGFANGFAYKYLEALTLFNKHKFRQCIPLFRECLVVKPTHICSFKYALNACANSHLVEEAIVILKNFKSNAHNNSKLISEYVNFLKSYSCFHAENYRQLAIYCINELRLTDNLTYELEITWLNLFQDLGYYEECEAIFEKYNKVERKTAAHEYQLAQFYMSRGRYSLALELIEPLTTGIASLENEHLWILRFNCKRGLGLFDECLKECIIVEENFANKFEVHHAMAICYAGLNEFRLAHLYIDKTIAAIPFPDTYLTKASILLKENKDNEAFFYFILALYLDGGKFSMSDFKLLYTFSEKYNEPFIFNSIVEVNNFRSILFSSIKPHIQDNFEVLQNVNLFLSLPNSDMVLAKKIKVLIYYLGHDFIPLQRLNITFDKIDTQFCCPTIIFLQYKVMIRFYPLSEQFEKFIISLLELWANNLNTFSAEEIYFVGELASILKKQVIKNKCDLIIQNAGSVILKKVNSNYDSSQLFYIEELKKHKWGLNLNFDYKKLQGCLILQFSIEKNGVTVEFNPLDFFSFSEKEIDYLKRKIRENEIEKIIENIIKDMENTTLFSNTDERQAELESIENFFKFNPKKKEASDLFNYLEKAAVNKELFENAFGLLIHEYKAKDPWAYYQLLKYYLLRDSLTIGQFLLLYFYIVKIDEENKKTSKLIIEAIEKAEEEFTKGTLKALLSGFFKTVLIGTSGFSEILIATVASGFAKLFVGFLKSEEGSDYMNLLDYKSDYIRFKEGFYNHISCLYESLGETKFKSIYSIDYKSLLEINKNKS